ncbi:MAG TPA: hypothetical protein VJY62_11740 [Bacteroidia bacterium]|nr:hypothetical protein [Bacteroidia bacterium]
MQKKISRIAKYLMGLVALTFIFSCKKEHLEIDSPPGSPEPLIYITAKLNTDSVYFTGGINSYVGSASVSDTLTYRTFNFTLKNPQNSHSYFQISINNYKNVQGVLLDDLDSSIYTGARHYQDTIHFMPLAATVVWIDSAGVRFSSVFLHQTHLFSIQSVEDIIYENKNYKKLTVQFVCNLRDMNGHILHLTNGNAIIILGIN